eukprot:1161423-Pelagomonas_calceolata.AAC.10
MLPLRVWWWRWLVVVVAVFGVWWWWVGGVRERRGGVQRWGLEHCAGSGRPPPVSGWLSSALSHCSASRCCCCSERAVWGLM